MRRSLTGLIALVPGGLLLGWPAPMESSSKLLPPSP
jgi:hypothetical protein